MNDKIAKQIEEMKISSMHWLKKVKIILTDIIS